MDNQIANWCKICSAFAPLLARRPNMVGLWFEAADPVDVEPTDRKCEFSAKKGISIMTCTLSGSAYNDGLVWTIRLTICLT